MLFLVLHDAADFAVAKTKTLADLFEEALRELERAVLQVATEKLSNFGAGDVFRNICGEVRRFVRICKNLRIAHPNGVALVVGNGPGAKLLPLAILVVCGGESLVEIGKVPYARVLGIAESPSNHVGALSGKLDGCQVELLAVYVVDEGVADGSLLTDDDLVIPENEKFGVVGVEHVVVLRVVGCGQQRGRVHSFVYV